MTRNPFLKSINFTVQSILSPIQATKLIKDKCEKGLLKEARQLFDEMPHRDVVAWTAMIAGYTSHGDHRQAWMVFRGMRREGPDPNAFTVSNVLKACKGMESWFCGAIVHEVAVKHGVDRSVYVENALLDMYATCAGSMDDARMVFDEIPERTAVTWTTMIAGYTRRGEGYFGIRVFRQMLQVGLWHLECP